MPTEQRVLLSAQHRGAAPAILRCLTPDLSDQRTFYPTSPPQAPIWTPFFLPPDPASPPMHPRMHLHTTLAVPAFPPPSTIGGTGCLAGWGGVRHPDLPHRHSFPPQRRRYPSPWRAGWAPTSATTTPLSSGPACWSGRPSRCWAAPPARCWAAGRSCSRPSSSTRQAPTRRGAAAWLGASVWREGREEM